jgi:hypothetical protein
MITDIFSLVKECAQKVQGIAQGAKHMYEAVTLSSVDSLTKLTNEMAIRIVNKVYDETKIDRTDKIKLGSIKLKKLQLKKARASTSMEAKPQEKMREKDLLIAASIAIVLRQWIEDPSNGSGGLDRIAGRNAQRFVPYHISEYLKANHVKRNKQGKVVGFFPDHKTVLQKKPAAFVKGILQAIVCGVLAAENPKKIDLYQNAKKALDNVQKKLKGKEKALKYMNEEIAKHQAKANQQDKTVKSQDKKIKALEAKLQSISITSDTAQDEKNKLEKELGQRIREQEAKLNIAKIKQLGLQEERNALKKEIAELKMCIATLRKVSRSYESSPPQAIGVFYRPIDIWGEHLFCLGGIHMKDRDYGLAIDCYEAIEKYEEDIVIEYNLGNAYYRRGKKATNADAQKRDYEKALSCYKHEKAKLPLVEASHRISGENDEMNFKWCFESNRQRAYDALYPPGLRRPVRWAQRGVQKMLDKEWGLQANIALKDWKLVKQRPKQAKDEEKLNSDTNDKTIHSRDKGKQHASGSASILRKFEQANTASDKQENINTQKGENQKTAEKSSKQDNLSSTEQCLKKDRDISEEASASCSKVMTEDHIPLSTTTKKSARTQKLMDFANHFSPVVADHQEPNPEENTPSPKVMQRS